MNVKLLLIIGVFSTIISMGTLRCKKDNKIEEEFPPATSIGAEKLVCRVNGVVWKSSPSINLVHPSMDNDYISKSKILSVKGNRYPLSGNESVIVELNKCDHIGNYPINGKDGFGGYWKDSEIYSADSLNIGSVNITRFDTINKIISGTFAFNAKLRNGTEVVKITEGWFDIKYY